MRRSKRQSGYNGQYPEHESITAIQGLSFAFPKGSDLVEPINAAMWALQANGVWDEIFAKWFE